MLASPAPAKPKSVTLTAPKTKQAKLFRNNRSQAVRIPVEFELPGTQVLIHRDGNKLIIEPVAKPANILELLSQWRSDAPPGADEQFPAIIDAPATAENVF